MGTTIKLYKTQLSPFDIDRPNDMVTYLSTCDSETVQSARDMRFELLSEIEVMTSSVSGFDLMDCNYLEIVNTDISNKKWRYFVIAAAYSKSNVAKLTLQVDPWGCVCDWAGELYINSTSFVKRAPRVYDPDNDAVITNLVSSRKGSTIGMTIYYRAGGTTYANSFDGRGVPVVFAEVTDNLSETGKTYRVAFFSPTVSGSYYNQYLNAQFQFLIDCIKDINMNGQYSLTVTLSGAGSITLNNVMVKQITGAYIVPSYALAGLYNTAEYWTLFDTVGALFVDTDPINRAFEQFIGAERTPSEKTPTRLLEEVSPLYIGNGREAVQIKRSFRYNGARLSWSMGSDGFCLTVHEIANTMEMHDLTNAIVVPNVETSFFNVTATTETEKTLKRVSSGVAVIGGVAAVAGGIYTANPVAVVAGAGTIARAGLGAIEQEKKYIGEGANGFVSHGAGVDFSQYHRLVYSNATADIPPHTVDRAIPIITAFTVFTDEGYELANYYQFNGVPVGEVPAMLKSLYSGAGNVPLNIMNVYNLGDSLVSRCNYWLFESVSIHVTGGISPFVNELTQMLTTTGVRVWDTTTVENCNNFKLT